MKYLLFTLLCSLSVAQAMERQSLAQMGLSSIQDAIKKEETTIKSELSTLLQTTPDKNDYVALYEKETAQHRLKSRLADVTDMLQWIQTNTPTYKEISAAFRDYQETCDRLKTKASANKMTFTYSEGLEKKAHPQNARVVTAKLGAFEEEDEEDAELTIEQTSASQRSQSVPAYHITVPTSVRSHSAPITIKRIFNNPLSEYISSFVPTPISEEDENTHAASQTDNSALTTPFETRLSVV